MIAPTPETVLCELRVGVTAGHKAPEGFKRVPDITLRDFRSQQQGTYRDLMAIAIELNDAAPKDEHGDRVLTYYPHPVVRATARVTA